MSDFMDRCIYNWETKNNMAHKGSIEIEQGKLIEYYDEGFVKDLMIYMEFQHNKIKDLENKMLSIHKDLGGSYELVLS